MNKFNLQKSIFDATDWAWHDIQDRCEFNVENAGTSPTATTISISSVSIQGESGLKTFGTSTTAATGKFVGGVLAPNGSIYFIPYDETVRILKLTPGSTSSDADSVCVLPDVISTTTGSDLYFGGVDQLFWGGVLAPNGCIYGIPYSADYVLKIDTETDTFSRIPTEITSDYSDTTTMRWCGGALAPNGIIYCAPYNAGYVLKIDTKTDELSVMKDGDSPIDVDTSGDYYSGTGTYCYQGAVLAPNGKVYFIPYNAKYIAEVDPWTDTLKMYTDYPVNSDSVGIDSNKFSGGVLAPDGYIYMIPCRANKILKFNAKHPDLSGYDVITPNFKTTNTTYYKYCGGVLAPNGNIFFVPLDSNASSTYSHRPYVYGTLVTDVSEEFHTQTTYAYKWRGGVLAPNGCIYCAPFGRNTIYKFNPTSQNINFGLATLLSPYLNKF